MIWAILALLGVPLWLCAGAITVLVLRNHAIRNRGTTFPCGAACQARSTGRAGTQYGSTTSSRSAPVRPHGGRTCCG